MHFLNMYSLFNLKSGIAELQAREDKVSLEQYSVTQFCLEVKFKALKCIYRRKMTHVYSLKAVKLLFHCINYPPGLQPWQEYQKYIIYPNITVTFFHCRNCFNLFYIVLIC